LVGKYLTEEGSVSYPIKPNPPSNVRLSVRPSVRLSGWTGKLKARVLGLGMQILGLLAQSKFVSAECHAHNHNTKTHPAPYAKSDASVVRGHGFPSHLSLNFLYPHTRISCFRYFYTRYS